MKRILVIDDEVEDKNEELLFRKIGEKVDAEVSLCSCPFLSPCLIKFFNPDLILMDCHFKNCIFGETGEDVVKKIRKISKIHIVMISSDENNNHKGIKAGANASLLKTIDGFDKEAEEIIKKIIH